jgi:hypothetical protein
MLDRSDGAAGSSQEASLPTAPPITTPPAMEFHIVTEEGWEYDLTLEMPSGPPVVITKDVSTSPPGQAQAAISISGLPCPRSGPLRDGPLLR